MFSVMLNNQSCSCNGKCVINSYFDILPMSKSLVTSKLFSLEIFVKYIVKFSELLLQSLQSNN